MGRECRGFRLVGGVRVARGLRRLGEGGAAVGSRHGRDRVHHDSPVERAAGRAGALGRGPGRPAAGGDGRTGSRPAAPLAVRGGPGPGPGAPRRGVRQGARRSRAHRARGGAGADPRQAVAGAADRGGGLQPQAEPEGAPLGSRWPRPRPRPRTSAWPRMRWATAACGGPAGTARPPRCATTSASPTRSRSWRGSTSGPSRKARGHRRDPTPIPPPSARSWTTNSLDDLFQGVGASCPQAARCEDEGGRPGSALQTQRRALEARWTPPWRPAVGIAPKLSDAELVTLAVMQALLGYPSEARWLRYARAHLGHLFPYLPKQPGYNKRLRAAAALLQQLIRALASDTTFWTDDVWVADSTPVECGRSTQTVHRSELAGWAEYGYCASHSRYFWGLRLHLVCTLAGLPVGFALAGAKADEREVLLGILAADPALLAQRPGQTLIADKNYFGGAFEAALAAQGVRLLRPARKGEPERAGAHLFKPLRQVIESINDTFKGQLDLERHGGHTPAGVIVRVLQRILALTAAIWHNDHTGQPTPRSLLAYDH